MHSFENTFQMCAKTTVMASSNFTENKFWLNGKEEAFDNFRLQNCLKEGRYKLSCLQCYHWTFKFFKIAFGGQTKWYYQLDNGYN